MGSVHGIAWLLKFQNLKVSYFGSGIIFTTLWGEDVRGRYALFSMEASALAETISPGQSTSPSLIFNAALLANHR